MKMSMIDIVRKMESVYEELQGFFEADDSFEITKEDLERLANDTYDCWTNLDNMIG